MTALPPDITDVLSTMGQATNGDDVYNNDKALHGFLDPSLFMLIPEQIDTDVDAPKAIGKPIEELGKIDGFYNAYENDHVKYVVDVPYLDSAMTGDIKVFKMMAINYVYMITAGLTNVNAFAVAALRTRWSAIGGYRLLKFDNTIASRRVEHIVVTGNAQGTIYEQIVAANTLTDVYAALGTHQATFVAAASDSSTGSHWIIRHADAFWAASEYVFRIRGHHFKDTLKEGNAYKNLYDKYLQAFYEGDFEMPAGIDHATIFRTAIHPFKMRALPILTMHLFFHGTLANAAIIRLSGSPVGNAVITTTAAALNTMRSEVWYHSFEKAYSSEVSFVQSVTEAIEDNKYGYHMSASLYGVRRMTSVEIAGTIHPLEKTKGRISVVAAACQGLIQALSEAVNSGHITGFALSNAKALEKAASNAPTVTLKVKELVEIAIVSISDAKDLATAVERALPVLNEIE